MKAVIVTGGKQYYVSENDVIYVEKLGLNEGDKVEFNDVLMVDDKVGTPYLDGAKVEGVVLKNGKQKKITIFKYNQKKKYRKKQGHRQPYTKVEIKSIKVK